MEAADPHADKISSAGVGGKQPGPAAPLSEGNKSWFPASPGAAPGFECCDCTVHKFHAGLFAQQRPLYILWRKDTLSQLLPN